MTQRHVPAHPDRVQVREVLIILAALALAALLIFIVVGCAVPPPVKVGPSPPPPPTVPYPGPGVKIILRPCLPGVRCIRWWSPRQDAEVIGGVDYRYPGTIFCDWRPDLGDQYLADYPTNVKTTAPKACAASYYATLHRRTT